MLKSETIMGNPRATSTCDAGGVLLSVRSINGWSFVNLSREEVTRLIHALDSCSRRGEKFLHVGDQ